MNNFIFKDKCIIISTKSNLYYFSNYQNADAVIIFYKNKKYYFTDARYFEEANALLNDFGVLSITSLDSFICDNGIKEAYIENQIPLSFYKELMSFGIENFLVIDEEINAKRAIKQQYELENIIKAQSITDKTFLDILPLITEGISEKQLANKLESILLSNGADAMAFSSIVAFGENTSKPHATKTDKTLQKNMPILLDFGAKFDGYCSDMTRTIFFGEPTTEWINLYNKVLNAQLYALSQIRVGISGSECDKFARDFLQKQGLEQYFLHSLGHGVGIDIHESPNFSPKCHTIMSSGMVMSVEPGVYWEGKYGIRIEDLIYFEQTGIKNLTKSRKDIIILK